MEAPDYVTDSGVEVWRDISDQYLPCDLIREPTDNAERYQCAVTAERRYGRYNVCNYHFERGLNWASQES